MITRVKTPTAILCICLLILVGTIGTYLLKADSTPVSKNEPLMDSHIENYTDSYQFENMLGAGHTSNETVNMTHHGNMTFWINVSASFHEPVAGDRGYVRIILLDNETEIFNNVTSTDVMWTNMSNLSQQNLTIVVQSVGSDGTITGEPVADYYVMELTAHVMWESES